jgi:hypothetical protein
MENKFTWFSLISLGVAILCFFISQFIRVPTGSDSVAAIIFAILFILIFIFVLLSVIFIIISLVKKENLKISIPVLILIVIVGYFSIFLNILWR